MRHYILIAVLLVSVMSLNAQTPFDSYAPEHRDKVIIELENEEPFRVENSDTESKARYAEFDNQTLCLNILDSANNIIAVVVLAPDDKKFLSVDPLSDKYPNTSPYAYCNNNPVMLVDPDGREITLSGVNREAVLEQMQTAVGNSISLSMNEYGKVSFTKNGDYSENASRLTEVITDRNINVNIINTEGKFTPMGDPFIADGFLGNIVLGDKVEAYQMFNTNVLNKADPTGSTEIHGVTEAYEGAKLAQQRGFGAGNSKTDWYTYIEAHHRATKQTIEIHRKEYNKFGFPTKDPSKVVKVKWSVVRNGRNITIQTIDQNDL